MAVQWERRKTGYAWVASLEDHLGHLGIEKGEPDDDGSEPSGSPAGAFVEPSQARHAEGRTTPRRRRTERRAGLGR